MELELDHTTAKRLFPVLFRYETQRRALRADERELRARLAKEVRASTARDDVLATLIEAILANQRSRRALARERFVSVRAFLTPAQQAGFLLLSSRGRRSANR